jgi:hypothetical protein
MRQWPEGGRCGLPHSNNNDSTAVGAPSLTHTAATRRQACGPAGRSLGRVQGQISDG